MLGYLECGAGIALMGLEAWLILRRNRTILLKGKDDLLPMCIIMAAALTLCSPGAQIMEASEVTAVGGMVILLAAIFSMAVARGVSRRGIEKFCWCIPWKEIRSIQIQPYQVNKIKLIAVTDRSRQSLIYPSALQEELIREIERLSEGSVKV